MQNQIKKFILIVSVLALASCAHLYGEKGAIKNRDTEYLKAQSIPPLKIPPGYSSSTFQTYYPVSEKSYRVEAEKVSVIPPGLNEGGK